MLQFSVHTTSYPHLQKHLTSPNITSPSLSVSLPRPSPILCHGSDHLSSVTDGATTSVYHKESHQSPRHLQASKQIISFQGRLVMEMQSQLMYSKVPTDINQEKTHKIS
uniref:Uncharacterized protein n=1 Tax=Rhizophora mucronata TaxID=61149 RepID=A0A2P2QMP9_RHIMU